MDMGGWKMWVAAYENLTGETLTRLARDDAYEAWSHGRTIEQHREEVERRAQLLAGERAMDWGDVHRLAVQAADATAAALPRHGRDWDKFTWTAGGNRNGFRTCLCGREFTTPNGLGLHVGAAQRKEDKVWNDTLEAKKAELTQALDRAYLAARAGEGN